MLIFGAVDFTAALARLAKLLGYRVTVCDAREVFATQRRFPMADEVVVDWPHRLLERVGPTLGPRDAVCVLTHDAKFDVPAIVAALAHRRRLPRGDGQPADPRRAGRAAAGGGRRRRPASSGSWRPIGLDIGARTPEETAMSICAEIIALRTGRERRRVAPRHRRPDPRPLTGNGSAAVVLAAGGGSRFAGPDAQAARRLPGRPVVAWAVEAARRRPVSTRPWSSPARSTLRRWSCRRRSSVAATTRDGPTGQATSLAAAVDWAARDGHDAIVVGLGDQPLVAAEAWRRWPAATVDTPIVVAAYDGRRGNPVRLDRSVWPLLPRSGDEGARVLMRERPELVAEVPCAGRAGRHRHRGGSRSMELTNEFRVDVPVDEAWTVLTDVERIAPCMPGAQLQEIEGDEYRGIVKVKVGPITAQYKGAARFVEKDEDAHRAVLRAEGRDTRGQGNANATITATLEPDGDGTKVTRGHRPHRHRPGGPVRRGVMADVSTKLLGQFVDCLEQQVLGGHRREDDSDAEAASVAATDEAGRLEASAGTDEPAIVRRSERPPSRVQGPRRRRGGLGRRVRTPPARVVRDLRDARTPAAPAEPASAIRRVDSPDAEPVDLLETAGAPVAKRAVPVVLGGDRPGVAGAAVRQAAAPRT